MSSFMWGKLIVCPLLFLEISTMYLNEEILQRMHYLLFDVLRGLSYVYLWKTYLPKDSELNYPDTNNSWDFGLLCWYHIGRNSTVCTVYIILGQWHQHKAPVSEILTHCVVHTWQLLWMSDSGEERGRKKSTFLLSGHMESSTSLSIWSDPLIKLLWLQKAI